MLLPSLGLRMDCVKLGRLVYLVFFCDYILDGSYSELIWASFLLENQVGVGLGFVVSVGNRLMSQLFWQYNASAEKNSYFLPGRLAFLLICPFLFTKNS